eukprot:gene2448-3217_t
MAQPAAQPTAEPALEAVAEALQAGARPDDPRVLAPGPFEEFVGFFYTGNLE